MDRPSLPLWDKGFAKEMYDWCVWNVENTEHDNLDEFLKSFMKMMNGKMNPKIVIDIWNERNESK